LHYWADLQSVHGFRCYNNVVPNAKCQRVLVLVLYLFFGCQAELSGDPWTDFTNNQPEHDYWDWAYFAIVTMSTVGYGDIACKTVFGRIFIIIFIFGALVSST